MEGSKVKLSSIHVMSCSDRNKEKTNKNGVFSFLVRNKCMIEATHQQSIQSRGCSMSMNQSSINEISRIPPFQSVAQQSYLTRVMQCNHLCITKMQRKQTRDSECVRIFKRHTSKQSSHIKISLQRALLGWSKSPNNITTQAGQP